MTEPNLDRQTMEAAEARMPQFLEKMEVVMSNPDYFLQEALEEEKDFQAFLEEVGCTQPSGMETSSAPEVPDDWTAQAEFRNMATLMTENPGHLGGLSPIPNKDIACSVFTENSEGFYAVKTQSLEEFNSENHSQLSEVVISDTDFKLYQVALNLICYVDDVFFPAGEIRREKE